MRPLVRTSDLKVSFCFWVMIWSFSSERYCVSDTLNDQIVVEKNSIYETWILNNTAPSICGRRAVAAYREFPFAAIFAGFRSPFAFACFGFSFAVAGFAGFGCSLAFFGFVGFGFPVAFDGYT